MRSKVIVNEIVCVIVLKKITSKWVADVVTMEKNYMRRINNKIRP